jgi:hypothetical protein
MTITTGNTVRYWYAGVGKIFFIFKRLVASCHSFLFIIYRAYILYLYITRREPLRVVFIASAQ